MKKILILFLGGIISLSAFAQTLTITFNGTNKNKNYQVMLDGTSYYSNSSIDPNNSNANVRKEITLSNQQVGSHTIQVYRLRNNSGIYSNGTNTTTSGNALYSNNFQLRQGYDMIINITGNGQVTFSEKRIKNRGNRDNNNQQNMAAMSDASFNQLSQTVRSKWQQSAKITAESNAFSNTTNYFSTSQVRQMLLIISGEANRLALAKLSYPRIVDAANFTQLYDVFSSRNSRNDLDNFVRNNPNNNGSYNNNGNYNNTQYKTPIADYQYNQILQNVNRQYNQTQKFNEERSAFNVSANYFSTSQIRQLLSLITSEPDRLSLAKLSYSRSLEPANFSTLYDLFYNQANRNDLNNFVIQNGGSGTNVQYNNNRVQMADASFTQVLQKASNHFLPWDKVRDVRDAFNNTSYYFNTAQIRQLLSLATGENDKLELAKLAWSRVTDPSYFTQLSDLFTAQSSRDDLNNYISAHPF